MATNWQVSPQNPAPYVDTAGLKQEMASWQFHCLHWLRNHTRGIAFFSGHAPYHNIAFQFSHHRVDMDGAITHATQFLLADSKINPNSQLARRCEMLLKWQWHGLYVFEPWGTTLNAIHEDLETEACDDAKELQAFIESMAAPRQILPNLVPADLWSICSS